MAKYQTPNGFNPENISGANNRMNASLAELLHGAGLGDIVMPRKAYIKEHRHLVSLLNQYDIPALKKEAADQTKEVKDATGVKIGGMGQASGFIRRLMAENALKHKGQYKKPTYPLAKGSTMNKPAEFDYRRIANGSQRGINHTDYGASPFIQRHFGHARSVPFERKRGEAPPTEPYKKKRKSKKEKTEESEQQKAARKAFVVPAPADEGKEAEEEEEEDVDEYGKVAMKKYIDQYFEDERQPINYFVPQKGGESKGGECVWFAITTKTIKGKDEWSNRYEKIVRDPPIKIKPGFNLTTLDPQYEWGHGTSQRIITHYRIPKTECVLKYKGDEVAINQVETRSITHHDIWKLAESHTGSTTYISVKVITKTPLPKEYWKQIPGQHGWHGHYFQGHTQKHELNFSFKELAESNRDHYVGWRAALINYGAKQTYKIHDEKQRYTFNREDPDEEEIEKYKKEIHDTLHEEYFDPDWSLTINGKEYAIVKK